MDRFIKGINSNSKNITEFILFDSNDKLFDVEFAMKNCNINYFRD